jgi:hypothetical protein
MESLVLVMLEWVKLLGHADGLPEQWLLQATSFPFSDS